MSCYRLTVYYCSLYQLCCVVQDSRKVLGERDEELVRVRSELERYRQQAAREIANKTKLAQSLDQSHTHAQELEELLQQWQFEVRTTHLTVKLSLLNNTLNNTVFKSWRINALA